MLRHVLYFLFITTSIFAQEKNLFYAKDGVISFRSEAQQELIRASSSNMVGILDTRNRTFVFKVVVRTFKGFNSALQLEHFNEKYLESEKFPEALFTGKIIEDLDLSIEGNYEVRAKGKLKIHGVEMERIIRCKVTSKDNRLFIESQFTILLSDHDIKIPRVVHEKIASEIQVEIKAELIRNDKIDN
jgi:hypothetical protein